MRVLRCLLFLGVCLGLAAPGGPAYRIEAAQAQPAQTQLVQGEAPSLRKFLRREKDRAPAPGRGNIGAALDAVLTVMENRGITRANARARNAAALSNPWVRVDEGGRIQVYAHLRSYGTEELTAVRALEVEIELGNAELRIVQGWAPFDRIEGIAALPFVTRVTPPSYGRLRAGSKTTEGDTILKADRLRARGVDGTGAKVGIISDGATDWTQARATGDLPAGGITLFGSCTKRPFSGPICDSGRTCNEGTAMAEIVHDLAPGAQIAVAAVNTSLEFIARLNDLVNSFKADIIVDDLGFFGEPFFRRRASSPGCRRRYQPGGLRFVGRRQQRGSLSKNLR